MSKCPNDPIRVCITGAAGQIGYAIIPMIASGDMFGPKQKVILHLLDLPFAMTALGGAVMEIDDGKFPLVAGVVPTSDPNVGFKDCDAAVLLGAFPRKQGMERKDLMEKNVGIFKEMGLAIEKNAKKTIKVLVVGNPANTNALICAEYAPSVPKRNFTAMTRLDHNRAMSMVALKAGANVADVQNIIIWGNHSSTQYPDVSHATIKGKGSVEAVLADEAWLHGKFITDVQTRGATIINARKASSALSAARGAVCHMHDWFCGTPAGQFVSMGVYSEGCAYGIEKGLMYSMPCTCENGEWKVVEGLQISNFSRDKMRATEQELSEEKILAKTLIS